MDWQVLVDTKVRKKLKRVEKREADRIRVVVKDLVYNPYAGDVEKIKGDENVWRRRVGQFRIFYEINPKEKVIYVFALRRRTSTTYR